MYYTSFSLWKKPILNKFCNNNKRLLGFSFKMPSRLFQTLNVTTPKEFVYQVELNRPSKRNAMDTSMWSEIKTCFQELSKESNCRVVVLSGIGAMFCSGVDLQCFMDLSQDMVAAKDVARKSKILHEHITSFQDSLSSIEKCAKPVICGIHNGCIGAGVDLISAADIRFCTADAWFQIKEVDIGLAADIGTLQRFPKIIGNDSLARELVYTGRKFLAAEAEKYGLVSRILDTKENLITTCLSVAEVIASKSPVAIQTSKKSLIYSRDHSVAEGLEHIALLNQLMLQSEDVQNAVIASVTKDGSPVFSKL